MRSGPARPARVFAPGLGQLLIETVGPVDLHALVDDDARADGFDTADALRQVLRELHPLHAEDGRGGFRVPRGGRRS